MNVQPAGQVRRQLIGKGLREEQLLDSAGDLDTYDHDGFGGSRHRPGLVVLCESASDVVASVRACKASFVPWVARGAGTGLSGGATPPDGGVVIALAGCRDVGEVAPADGLATLGPGVTNLEISSLVGVEGLFYAPDPSSQVVCTIGGNVAENSGGAHCLKYGFTTHHVLGVEIVTPEGDLVALGGDVPDVPGYDLRGVFVGSEGTLGAAVRITVRVVPRPQAVRTVLVDFPSVTAAGSAVAGIVGAQIVPACLEMMDQLAMQACEAATGAGLPLDAAAVLIIECDGHPVCVEEDVAAIEVICREAGARSFRLAADAAERATIWRARKAAFAAMGRLAPDYIVQDGVVPRGALPTVLARIEQLAAGTGLRVANVFHAGDGNLHPLVLFDAAEPGASEDAEALAETILTCCLELGGSITGEHGVGVDKACMMPLMFSEDDLTIMDRVRRAFDPTGLCNPDKVLPTPRLCGESPGPYRRHPIERAGLA
ncbi:MAG TPA: FAD-linked oxidase C-terminal domain-containing protein, partial [Acidimicrobiales bacterium]|nr:FAD-linked oxidase C-terminal domain-containing protein [Acidimicrobiales bacterium]